MFITSDSHDLCYSCSTDAHFTVNIDSIEAFLADNKMTVIVHILKDTYIILVHHLLIFKMHILHILNFDSLRTKLIFKSLLVNFIRD